MSNTNYVAFFGDRKRDFRLTPALITELERLTGMGIGAFCQRLFAMDFRHADMLATIRLALIGGGTSHEEADRLVRTYGADHPIMHVYPLAVEVLDHLWSGPRAEDETVAPISEPEAPEPSPQEQEPSDIARAERSDAYAKLMSVRVLNPNEAALVASAPEPEVQPVEPEPIASAPEPEPGPFAQEAHTFNASADDDLVRRLRNGMVR